MKPRAIVPCNGCTVCCGNDLIVLHPECGDDPARYETQTRINPLTGLPVLALKQKPGGGCIYLGESGCEIHDHAPAICQEFDCRRFTAQLKQRYSRAEIRRMIRDNLISNELLRVGLARLAETEEVN